MNKDSFRTDILTKDILEEEYGLDSCECKNFSKECRLVFSKEKAFDLIELEQLLQSVGWGRRPLRRVRKALENSILQVGLWQHDPKFPRLIGFARCTGDGILEATIWDVAIHPVYQGSGLGKELMTYVLRSLRQIGVKRATLFADSEVIEFYKSQGWTLEPKNTKCAFWYAN